MSDQKPIIISVDDDEQVLRSLRRDLRQAYKKNYSILSTSSANEMLDALVEIKKNREEVALMISDQRMPEMEGVEFLEKARVYFPDAKRVLLTAYSDTDAAIKAINDVQLDYYLMKPWNPPEEKLLPVVSDLLDEWESNYQPKFKGITLVGYQYSPKSHQIKDYLSGNLISYRWLDISSDEGQELMTLHGFENKDLPVIEFEDQDVISRPSIQDVAVKLGMPPHAKEELYDVVIVGAGPAGLAAAVYGGSEGLKTLLIEKRAPGGQAGTSSRIENYLGFPKGLSGSELARRAITQATRFGIEFLSPQTVSSIEMEGNYKVLHLENGDKVSTKSIIIATGVDYRRFPQSSVESLTGAGVYYGAATTEANGCKNQDVYIIGGGNSAGQGAVYLSKFAKKVVILIRRADLSHSMSSYLIEQIESIENIELRAKSQVIKAYGENHLESLDIEHVDDGSVENVSARALFIFIGARPATSWLPKEVLRNEKGYIHTGLDVKKTKEFGKLWKLDRNPFTLESSIPGIFASGDVRSGAMNRVAAAVGEGAMSIKLVHSYLSTI